MELHFYTTFDGVQMLKEGDSITVWTKNHASEGDIRISLNASDYSFHKASTNVYEVSKIYKARVEFNK